MSINSKQLREHVIRPILKEMDFYSKAAENLLMGIAAQESHLGTYLRQINGPAQGIFQMEPATEQDIWERYLSRHRLDLAATVSQFLGSEPDPLVTNLAYQVAIARIKLWRVPEPLPVATDIPALAQYWKTHWNTALGRGTEAEFIENYTRFVDDEGDS